MEKNKEISIGKFENFRAKNKNNRMHGQKYCVMSGNNVVERKPRQMGEACSSKFCEKSTSRHCCLFSEDKRKEIFDGFWGMSWDQKKLYAINLIETSNRKRIYVESSRRSSSNFYYLKLHSNRI